ncbi:MAG: amino acid ABC transporter permease, partial [Mesorhizobium sp.]
MQEHDMSWVRTEMVLAQPAPASVTGLGAWVRKNLIASAGDTILTIVGIALVAMILPQIINWAFINAVWTGPDRTVCATVAQG